MKKFALCVLFLSLFTLSAHADPTNYTQNLNLPTFNKIDISGLANVQIHGRAKRTSVQITGDLMSIRSTTAAVKNDTLYITTQPNYVVKNGRLTVVVNAPALTQIRYTGSGQVKADHLNGPTNITANGKGPMELRGTVGLQNLTYDGNGLVSLYWVDSKQVNITGNGTGKIYLAGVAGLLDVQIGNQTWLDAKQLRAKRAFIKTDNKAHADVWVKDSLSTWAKGHSQISYYYDAGFVGGYMVPPATVLRMTNLNLHPSVTRNCCDDDQLR